MATIINSPGNTEESTATGMILGIILVLLVILFFVFGLPYIRNGNQPVQEEPTSTKTDINITVPSITPKETNNAQNP